MTSDEVLHKLVAILPGFGPFWDSLENGSRDDDSSFTLYGPFTECSHFVREQYETLTNGRLDKLGSFIGECMTPPGTELDNVAATCFLENLAGQRFSAYVESRASITLEQRKSLYRAHPTKAYLASWIARIFSLKNSWSRKPYACRFIVLILLFVPSSGPVLIG
jgi:hypothetical protein